jgi:hypothetical protein
LAVVVERFWMVGLIGYLVVEDVEGRERKTKLLEKVFYIPR